MDKIKTGMILICGECNGCGLSTYPIFYNDIEEVGSYKCEICRQCKGSGRMKVVLTPYIGECNCPKDQSLGQHWQCPIHGECET